MPKTRKSTAPRLELPAITREEATIIVFTTPHDAVIDAAVQDVLARAERLGVAPARLLESDVFDDAATADRLHGAIRQRRHAIAHKDNARS
jgi:hypothetical protein